MTQLTINEQQELQQQEAIIERGLQTFYEVGQALLAIKDSELYKEYGTFDDYCRQRWNLSPSVNYYLRKSVDVVDNLLQEEGVIPANLKQAIPLIQLKEPEQQRQAWRLANEAAAVIGGIISNKHVEAAVQAIKRVEQQEEFDYKRDNKSNRAANEYVPQGYDACQTPPYAIDPLLPYLDTHWTIWEPAQGERLLVEALYDSGFNDVVGSDLLTGQNFFEFEPPQWDALVTNPPFSLKYKWLERCYQLGKPFALLLPVETLGAKTAQDLFRQFGLNMIFMDKRVNFKMPNKGWEGGGAQFPVAWFTWGFNIGSEMVFARLTNGAEG